MKFYHVYFLLASSIHYETSTLANCTLPASITYGLVQLSIQVDCFKSKLTDYAFWPKCSIFGVNPIGSVIEFKCLKHYEWMDSGYPEKLHFKCGSSGWDGKYDFNTLKCRMICGEGFHGIEGSFSLKKRLSDWPWQVAIYRGFDYICAGSIINPYENKLVILTAAHCFGNKNQTGNLEYLKLFKVVAGGDNSKHIQTLELYKIKPHKYYNEKSKSNNIAIVEITPPIKLTDYSLPICLPVHTNSATEKLPGTTIVTVLNPRNNGNETSSYQWAYGEMVAVKTPYECDETVQVAINEYCKDICLGDNGAGIVFAGNATNQAFIQGISTSSLRNYQCGYETSTRVIDFKNWILSDGTDYFSDIPAESPFGRIKSNSKTGNGNTTHITITGVILLTLVIVGVVLFKIYFDRKNILTSGEIRNILNGKTSSENHEITSSTETISYNKSYEIPESELSIDKTSILGMGAFAIVFKGICKNQPVAVKTLKAGADKAYYIALLSELKIMMHLGPHPNLVMLIGAQTKLLRLGILHVVVQLCEQGSLYGYLNKHRDELLETTGNFEGNITPCQISTLQLLKWSLQICTGMEYLESKKVIHADIATRNVLLTQNLLAKVSDFGLSLKLYQDANYVSEHQKQIPWRWMAIESLQRLIFSHKSDVWSFGITLWEMYSLGDVPYPGMSFTLDFSSKLSDGLRLYCPQLATEDIFMVMQNCWHKSPDDRPNFPALKEMLINSLNKMPISEEYTTVKESIPPSTIFQNNGTEPIIV